MFDLTPAQEAPFDGLDAEALADVGPLRRGKVRDIVDLDDRLVLVSTDRVSAFDRVLGTVPFRGQILNELSAWWFRQISDIVASHMLAVPDPNVTVGRKCRTLPVEVVVRDRLTGTTSTALWTQYAAGQRQIYGMSFPDGMTKNEQLPQAIITPTTKAADGEHDTPITEADIVAEGLVDAQRWDEVRTVALEMFERGRNIAADAGLILVDTKYEFGLDEHDRLTVIDEVHTPDSSRYWRESSLQTRLDQGLEPENLDKELIRLVYVEQGYRGDGEPPLLDPMSASRAAHVYAEAFELLTGTSLSPAPYPAAPRVEAAIRSL
ncbi:MAG: phosphoribosylaminoimidazolesuccinocarboxamide synthase [Acidimicrobiaceae bacterium]|nr:phosphoribosylaminoimidazolesuccinocarboxamide synthase [Acidimicrobiaceae bacterium]MXW75540.1 phosphoribosylaminoimidazolesuccinocarboxamide synthase [Acidimicrobiaceae bacterium]MYA73196.1 phosphoribosylaminoimidazolesuccinocarboxamide synthase [Acidimicrobiaceae bacterium]MYD05878.1 phosphoribosylaminoimidazolesuccinocarboxamide synthase [Acidimicrobiaceae bacterium]MYG54996.1 phosphoribosylaminoimidazolesuccinocarboxamide synthase [Acidimicrobiaceae bacterium]